MDVVTGAFSYTGRSITRRLLEAGREVRTLTGHPNRPDPFGGKVSVAPYAFDDAAALGAGLRGAEVLYNTYWVRFPYRGTAFDHALRNTRTLLQSAEEAGVRRVVHISITNPSRGSGLAYFRGKALAEEAVVRSGMSYAIIRPTVIFGEGDVLINNIAWLARRLPLFGVPGTGGYRVRPVFVGDVADLAVDAGGRADNSVTDAVGNGGEPVSERARFCPACGSELRPVEAAREERKLVSVLFVDLVGFTSRSDRADPEDVRDALQLYHSRAKGQIEEYGGAVEKFIGDAVMAVFGAPLAHGDDAERAVRAGLRVLEGIEELNHEHPGLALSARAAVNTGEAVVAVGSAPLSTAWTIPSKIRRLAEQIFSVSSGEGSPSMPNIFFWKEPRWSNARMYSFPS